jgi:hypothetical protein
MGRGRIKRCLAAQRAMWRLRRQGRDADESELAGYANGSFAVSDAENAMTEPWESQAAPNQTADDIIADCDGDPRAAVIELLAIIRSLIHENQALREAASPGFARKRPIVFGRSE